MKISTMLNLLNRLWQLRQHERWTRPQMESIQGREEDTLQLPAVSGDNVAVQPLVFNRVMDILPVSGWQIAQQADNGLVVLLTGVRAGLEDAGLQDHLLRSLAQEGVRVPYLTVQHVAAIPQNASGKAPLIKAYRTIDPSY